MPDLLDIAYPPPPLVLVQDVRAAKARAVGVYAANYSVPHSVQTAGFVQAIRDEGVGVLPIVVPGNDPPPVGVVVQRLLGWGLTPADPVALDLERWSLPPLAWVIDFCDGWPQAGIYCQRGFRSDSLYGSVHAAFWWLAAWSDPPPVPIGWDLHQYGFFHGPSGATYDISTVRPGFRFWGAFATPQEDTMPNRQWFTITAGDPLTDTLELPGVNQDTNWNAVAKGGDAELIVQSFTLDGVPVGGLTNPLPRALTGKQAIFGQGFGLTGPGTAQFVAAKGTVVVAVGW